MKHGFIKAAAISPAVTVAEPEKNARSAVDSIENVAAAGAQVIALPELFITGYTCADLFFGETLLNASEKALCGLMNAVADVDAAIVVGAPVRAGDRLYNCAVVLYHGAIAGVVPKKHLPNYNEFYEKRWFAAGAPDAPSEVTLCGQTVPFGDVLFRLDDDAVLGIELCEDLWAPYPPSVHLALSGANIIVNIAASDEMVAKDDYRRELVCGQSARLLCGYVYSSAGPGESTTDVVFAGSCTIAENGALIAQSERFVPDTVAMACIDVQKLTSERRHNTSFRDSVHYGMKTVDCRVNVLPVEQIDRYMDPSPFVPNDKQEREKRCAEILAIQTTGLMKRMNHTGLKKTVVGISGGLDSTLALLVCVRTLDRLGLPRENAICITMPGFGTTDQTYNNAVELIHSVGATFMEISIKDACIQHFKDIGHDIGMHDITYENTQARERTQILMDIANKHGALLVGTGDLSELAMGWCTYSGDHMSMYGVNASIPKTLVRYLVSSWADGSDERTADVLRRVLATPVSPELLPPDEAGNIAQKTEETIGPYELHDFYLYHFVRFGCEPEKLLLLAQIAFEGKYDEAESRKWLRLFLRRFFISQFKRSCIPDGPKVGSVSLSPRGDWRMPSDAEYAAWLKEV